MPGKAKVVNEADDEQDVADDFAIIEKCVPTRVLSLQKWVDVRWNSWYGMI